MWILTHVNSLANTEEMKVITITNKNEYYAIYGYWNTDDFAFLGHYPTKQEAEQAIGEILKHIKMNTFVMPKYDNKGDCVGS